MKSLKTDGYSFFRSEISQDFVKRIKQEFIENLENNSKLVFEVNGELKTLNNEKKNILARSRCINFHQISKNCLELATNKKVTGFLSDQMNEEVKPIQTLTYLYSSQQGAHSDYWLVNPPHLKNNSMIRDSLCAAWFALDDVSEKNGTLGYYPKSHKIMKPNLFKDHDGNYKNYVNDLEQMMKKNKLKKNKFIGNRGDIFFWHGDLVHEGLIPKNKLSTRFSLVVHYAKAKLKRFKFFNTHLLDI